MDTSRTLIYTPDSALRRPLHMARSMLRDFAGARMLARQLALRDIRAQYRQTALGLAWAFALPLANTAAWLFIQGSGLVTIRPTSIPYPAYVLTGTILWSIFMDSVSAPLQQTNAARNMLAKLNFPREALILSGIHQISFNAVIKIGVLVVSLLFIGMTPGWGALLFPFSVLSLILAGTAVGLLITPVGMLYTDIGKGLPLLMQFLMYLTPVVFPMPAHGWAATLFQMNPLTHLLATSRELLTGPFPEHWVAFLCVNAVMLGVLFLAWVAYRVAMPMLIERMSA